MRCRKFRSLFLFIFFIVANISEAQVFSAEDKALLEKAKTESKNGNYQSCINICNSILSHSKNAEVYELIGMAYVAMQDYERGEFYVLQALAYGDHEPLQYFLLGRIQVLLGKFDEAEITFLRAQFHFKRLTSQSLEYYPFLEALGNVQRYKGEYRSAEENLKLAVGNNYTNGLLGLLIIYTQTKNYLELDLLVDKINNSSEIALFKDTIAQVYISTVNSLLKSRVNQSSLQQLNYAIKQVTLNTKGYNGLKFDLLYLKYLVLYDLGQRTQAYEILREYSLAHQKNETIKNEIIRLRDELGIDSKPPLITLVNPSLNEFNFYSFKGQSDVIDIYGRIEDESQIKVLTVNNKPIYTLEEDGIFYISEELHVGVNQFSIKAADSEGNLGTLDFIIKYEEAEISNDGFMGITTDDIPQLSKSITNYAILIAQNNYSDKNFNNLNRPIQDANELKNILTGLYMFDKKNIIELFNASKKSILDSLKSFSSTLGPNDNLFVFYAGHGDVKEVNKEIKGGYLIPTDASYQIKSSYISSEELLSSISKTSAKHVLMVVDACFGGALFRSVASDAPQYIKNYNTLNSRQIITSGNIESVPDEGEFIKLVKTFLSSNTKKYITALDLYSYISSHTTNSNSPQMDRIPNSGDTGGMFIFFLRD